MRHPSRPGQVRTDLPPALLRIEVGLVISFCLSVVFMIVERLRHVPGLQSRMSSPLYDRYTDFNLFSDKFRYFHTATFFHVGFPINYPAICAVFLHIFFRFAHDSLGTFLWFIALSFLVPAALFARALWQRGMDGFAATQFVFVTLGVSWPFFFLFDRANVEVLVFLLMLIGLWAYATGREWLAVIFFSLGAAAKIFPFVVLGIFVSRRQWGKLALGAVVAVVSSLLSLHRLGPTIPIATKGLLAGIAQFKDVYMIRWRAFDSGTDHSFFGLYKDLRVWLGHSDAFPRSLTLYLAVGAIGGVLLYLLRIRFLPLLNQILIFTIVSITFTAFSADYTLVQLYGPFCLLLLLAVEADRQNVTIPGLSFALGCFTFIFAVMTFLAYHDRRFIGPVKSLGLAVLLVSAFRFPFGPPLSESESGLVLSQPDLGWAKP